MKRAALQRAARRTAGATLLATGMGLGLGLAGCASAPAAGQAESAAVPANPVDPWEHWNRKVYAFNDTLDKAVVKPVAETYRKVVPKLVRQGVDNVLGNLGDIWSAANNLLQGKIHVGLDMGMRVLTNTFMGLGGLLDPATEMGLTRHSEDFGLTLGTWGFGNGPFVELPFFGPSTLRDGAGLVLDHRASPSQLPQTSDGRYAVTGIQLINTRTKLLDAGNLVDQVALDPYSFIRDAYLAQRRNALYDGAPPMETFDDSGADTATPAATPASSAASAPAQVAPAASAASAPR